MTIPPSEGFSPDDPEDPALRRRGNPLRGPGSGSEAGDVPGDLGGGAGSGVGGAEVPLPPSGLSGLGSLPVQRRAGDLWGKAPGFPVAMPHDTAAGTGSAMDRQARVPSHASIHIEPRAAALAGVRAWVRDYLHALPNPISPVAVGDIVVVVDELVSNAIKHGSPPQRLSLTCHPHSLLVAVEDSSPAAAAARTPDDTGGRGLHMLDAVARDWGQTWHQHGGKTVWAEMPLIA